MSNNVYNINWRGLSVNFLLVGARKPVFRAVAFALLKGLEILHIDFLAFRSECLYRAQHNSQKVYMRAMLNDLFDPEQRRITINNTVFKTPIHFYETEENRPVYFREVAPVYFHEASTIEGDGVDFTIAVPEDLRPSDSIAEHALLTRMRGEVDYYNLYGKNYKIIWHQNL